MISNKLTAEYFKIKDKIKEAYIAVGMVSDWGYDFFIRNLPQINPSIRISVVTGIHLPTPVSVFEKLIKDEKNGLVKARIFYKKFFHPKMYIFKLDDGFKAFVGSGNFTSGGWKDNEEFFLITQDQNECGELLRKFNFWWDESIDITQGFIDRYASVFSSNQARSIQNKRSIAEVVAELNGEFNIDKVNFIGQFFGLQHHLALSPEKTHLQTSEVLHERHSLRERLYQLNDLIYPSFPIQWDIHHHYDEDHIVAHIENNFHHDERVRSLWVAYGRSKENLKRYFNEATPLNFMRLQVIVHYEDVGIWLMPGKNGGSEFDRTYFKEQMRTDNGYRNTFFELTSVLGNDSWIEVAGESRPAGSFSDADELGKFTDNDNWRYHYFIIGRDYKLGAPELLQSNIRQTILTEFGKLIPLYYHMKHPLA